MRRALTWVVALPLAAASILAGHAAAYSLTGTPLGPTHGYLEHAPQIVAVLVLLALLGMARDGRARATSGAPVAALAAAGFVCQEHLERALHSGQLPLLLTSPAFWLGLALQLPFAAAVWLLARRLARTLAAPARPGPPRLATLPLTLSRPLEPAPGRRAVDVARGRGPPLPC